MDAPPAESVPFIGQVFGHYRVIQRVGAGAMGVVYRAHDEHLDCEVAIKVLPSGHLSDESSRKRFRKEALALSKLNHPNIATIHDFDTQQGVDFLVMEYIPGIPLSKKLADRPLPEKEVIRLGTQLAEGLAAAHEHGVVHRDLKPENLRLTPDGRLKILDFGLAKLRHPVTASAVTESLSETQGMAGTLPYMAPEQLLGDEIDARTDIHAAGAVLYEMATGKRPFPEVEQPQLIGAILRRAPKPVTALNPRVTPELEWIIGKCLEKEPENRYQSAREVAIDLQRLHRETDSHFLHTEKHTKRRWWTAVHSRAAAIAATAILLVILGRLYVCSPPQVAAASIAVLPFTDLSPGHDQEYFSDGVAEEILNELAKIPNLKVVARTSTFQFKNRNEDLRTIGKQLSVANVLEGSVRREGTHTRITAQLVKAEDGFSLWSESYDRDLKDIFAVQEEIAKAVTSALRVKLSAGRKSATSDITTPESYDALLRARHFAHMDDPESEKKALRYVNQAIELNPKYAPAYALRADVELTSGGMAWVDFSQATARARSDLEKAIALDPDLAEGYLLRSKIQSWYESNCREAEKSWRRALELAPNDPDNLEQGGLLAMCQGRRDEAVALWSKELLINPLGPKACIWKSQVLLEQGRYEESKECLGKALDLNPKISMVHEIQGEVYLAQGRPGDALNEMEKEPEEYLRDLGEALAYYALGRHGEADAALARLISQHQNDSAYQIAQVYAYRGEADLAFWWLNRAYSQHDPGLMWFKTRLTNLEKDPRYVQLLKKLNLSD